MGLKRKVNKMKFPRIFKPDEERDTIDKILIFAIKSNCVAVVIVIILDVLEYF